MPRQTSRGPSREEIGKLITAAWERCGWRQAHVAEATGIQASQLSELKHGKGVSLANLVEIAQALQVPMSFIFRDFEDPEMIDAALRLERVLGREAIDFISAVSDEELKLFYETGSDAVFGRRFRPRR